MLCFDKKPLDILNTMERANTCEHEHYDGGECMDCGQHMMCELCDKNEWETRCETCDGGRICHDCYKECIKCMVGMCIVCVEEATDGPLCDDCNE